MRTFIAVEIPNNIQQTIGEYVASIKGLFEGVKWILPENLHLTIKFLGEVSESELENLIDCIEKTAADFSPFVMGLSHTGFFPSQKKPKVVWIGADDGADKLLDLYQELEDCLENAGYDRETRMFSPHLTIGRAKRYKRIRVPETLPEFGAVTFDVKNIAIIKSTLTPHGPIYEKLFEGGLKQLSLYEG